MYHFPKENTLHVDFEILHNLHCSDIQCTVLLCMFLVMSHINYINIAL